MVVNIFPGQKFSRRKLLFGTNKFFGCSKFNRIIANHNNNYVVKIGKRSVKIVTSDAMTWEELQQIIAYIETMFSNCSVLVDSTDNLEWMAALNNVSWSICAR